MDIIATIICNGQNFRARILFPNTLEPVEFFRQTKDRDELRGWLIVEYPGIDIKTKQEFQMELDYIAAFGERWNPPEIISGVTDNEVIEVTTYGHPPKRMSIEDVMLALDVADEQLNEMENKLNAVLPSPLVDD